MKNLPLSISLSLVFTAWISACSSANSGETPYPPSGTTNPGGPCQRDATPAWVEFFCTYMTPELWKKAGKPYFLSADGDRFMPIYFTSLSSEPRAGGTTGISYEDLPDRPSHDGILEGLLAWDALQSEPNEQLKSVNFWNHMRYTPWSVYFERMFGCEEHEIVNPYLFGAPVFRRRLLLSFGSPQVTRDSSDPTFAFPEEAFLVLLMMSDLTDTLDGSQKARLPAGFSVRDEINAVAAGAGHFRPNYDHDGEVRLFKPDGSIYTLTDLDVAAAYVVGVGLLETNEAMRTWEDQQVSMTHFASERNRPIVAIYFAQDWFPPIGNNRVFRERYQYLIEKAASIARKTEQKFAVVGAGRSSHIVLSASKQRPEVDVTIMAPIPGPWGIKEYIDGLKNQVNEVRVMFGTEDPFTFLGYGSVMKVDKPKLCFGSKGNRKP